MRTRSRIVWVGLTTALFLSPGGAKAEVPVQRTRFELPSSNGFGAVLLDLGQRKLTHFREHVFATEEPLIDAAGNDVWTGAGFGSVDTRDLLYDAYFGVRVAGDQAWLPSLPADLDGSGFAGYSAGKQGGTGLARLVQNVGPLRLVTTVFAPRGLDHASFVMALEVTNTSVLPVTGVEVFSLHNFHLGYGRSGVSTETGENGETISYDGAAGRADFLERGFAGVVVGRALGAVKHHAAANASTPAAQSPYALVAGGGSADLPDLNGSAATADGSVSAYQWGLGTLAAGQTEEVAVVFAHHGDPLAGAAVQGWLDAYVGANDAAALVAKELAEWATFQGGLDVPAGLPPEDETLLRHSAAILRMGQNREDSSYLRDVLSMDGEPRRTRFGTVAGGPAATLPATVVHRGKGAVIASLPPGHWTYAWIRDGAYAAAAMAGLGMQAEAKDALDFYLGAEAGRFQTWNELTPYGMPPYQISLVRYHGFGVEETDFNDFGPNLEFDGFGLFLWALREYEQRTGDTSLADGAWGTVSQKVADVLVALIDPATGLLRPDSSIWETHWNGRERHFAYTNITAARGLCDAGAMAERMGDAALATKYRAAGEALRKAIADELTDASGAIAANTEELATGSGYWDAAVLDAIAMGLFHPQGNIAQATLAGLDGHLWVNAGPGWSRNDDRYDHAGGVDLSPWGSDYDSAEWVITDLRGAIAKREAGDGERADRLMAWVRDQAHANYLSVAETFDENDGTYKFNTPMVGFGAGAYALAVLHREGLVSEPACGAYYDMASGTGGAGGAGATTGVGGASASSGTGGAGGAGGTEPGTTTTSSGATGAGGGGASATPSDDGGCGCRVGPSAPHGAVAGLALALLSVLRRRARGKSRRP
jgi:hypothetical protein